MTMRVIKAVLGWSNPETAGGDSLRLYALDKGPSPRWMPNGGRTIERALIENQPTYEGNRYLVVHLGDRFADEELTTRLIRVIEEILGENDPDFIPPASHGEES